MILPRRLRTDLVVLSLLLGGLVGAFGLLYYARERPTPGGPFQAARNLVIKSHRNAGGYSIFERRNVFAGKEKSWQDLFRSIDKAYRRHKDTLELEWGLTGSELQGAFIMNVVAHMYALGNTERPDGTYIPGSVRSYHKQRRKAKGLPALDIMPVETYVRSPIGRCNDFATVLYMMFRLAGLEANHQGPPGHIFVEAKLDGKAYVFDAMYNFFTDQNTATFLNQDLGRRAVYHVFPISGSDPTSDQFRKRRGVRRWHYLLTQGRLRKRVCKDYTHWDRFEMWLRVNGVNTKARTLKRAS